jgi:acyl carrier protein
VLAAGPRRVVVTSHNLVEAALLGSNAAVVHSATGEAAATPEAASEIAMKQAIGSSTEASLAEIWSELLGVPKIDVDADFFELGGHSLLATRMMSRIFDIFGARISLRDVFDAPTVKKLALRVNSAQTGSDSGEDEEEREELIF